MTMLGKSGFSQCVGGQQMTGVSASTALTSVPFNATSAVLKGRSDFYLRLNGGTASAADMLIEAGVPVEITGTLADARIFGSGAIVDIWWFG